MTRKAVGRPAKFSAELGDEILGLLYRGLPRREIAARVGIGRRSLQEWLRRGRAGEPSLAAWAERFDLVARLVRRRRFKESVEREIAESKRRWHQFRAARERWWLERLGPREYWRRRLVWLAERGRWEAYHRTLEKLREEGFRTNATP